MDTIGRKNSTKLPLAREKSQWLVVIELEAVTLKPGTVGMSRNSWLIIRGLLQFYSQPRTIFIREGFCLAWDSPNELTQPTLLFHRLGYHGIRSPRPKIVPLVQRPKRAASRGPYAAFAWPRSIVAIAEKYSHAIDLSRRHRSAREPGSSLISRTKWIYFP